MRRASVARFFLFYFSFCVMSNFVHPITPVFLQSIGCPSYMFGVAFAALAFAIFISSPFWGKMGDRYGYARIMGIGFLGYALGQYLFSLATGPVMVVVGRTVGGLFSAGLFVNSMAYVASITEDGQRRAQYMAAYAATMSVGAAVGYLIGGSIGDHSLVMVFRAQVIGAIICAIFTLCFLGETKQPVVTGRLTAAEVNPLTAVAGSLKIVNRPMAFFLAAVFLTSFASLAHDQSFNYYLRAQLNFPPSRNGLFKAVVGLIALTANSTINIWIARRTDARRSIIPVLVACSLATVIMVLIPGVTPFLIAAIVFYAFNSVYLPIQQTLVIRNDGGVTKGAIAGLFNTVRSAGMVIGPLVSGFVYERNPLLPFVAAAVAFALAAGLCYTSYREARLSESLAA